MSSRRPAASPRPRAHGPAPAAEPPVVVVQNRQRVRRIDASVVSETTRRVLSLLGRDAEICIHFVSAREMARVNWNFLRHEGSTDVITFDHGSGPAKLHGELFVSVSDAIRQADEYGTEWTGEIIRYVIHGILHLCGHDDLSPVPRRAMKREENRLVRSVGRTNPSAAIARVPRGGSRSRRRHG